MPFPFNDMRDFIEDSKNEGSLELVKGADPDLEIGGITEMIAARQNPPILLFDEIMGHKPGFRIATNLFNTQSRSARVLGLDENLRGIELVKAWKQKIVEIKPIRPKEVSDGPIKENVMEGEHIDITMFPAPKWGYLDGGKFIGTGCSVITKHPDTGWVNVGTYRVMLFGKKNEVSINIAPGKHGDIIRKMYWEKGKNCPIVICLGQELSFFVAGGHFLTGSGESVFDFTGGLRGKPVEYIVGDKTGLPIPNTAEIAIEGELVPVSEKSIMDGPFGEWPGYITGAKKVPIVEIKKIYYRNKPIILGSPPLKPPLPEVLSINIVTSAALWREIEQHVPEVRGVWCASEGGTGGVPGFFVIVSIKQRYPGHSKQAGLAAAACRAGAYAGRYVVVVDDDIDPSNLSDVVWSIATRCDPVSGIDLIKNTWDSPVDPLLDPEKASVGDFTTNRAIINSCRPFHRLSNFPPVLRVTPETAQRILTKYPDLFERKGKPMGGFL